MYIKEVIIENFKCYKWKFHIKLNEWLNILVWDNEAWKSTILEAIHLSLTGLTNWKYLRNELTQYLFNNEIVEKYINDINSKKIWVFEPPQISIEIFIESDELPLYEWNKNSLKKKACWFSFTIKFDDKYKTEYELLVNSWEIKTLPIEYYDFKWESFARDYITPRILPIKSALIDSASTRFRNGSDVYISHIVRDFLKTESIVAVSQAHREMRDTFLWHKTIDDINNELNKATNISDKNVSLSVDLATKDAWENSLITCLDNVPFHHIWKWEQCIIKTKLALKHKKSTEANLLLLEEPENHLSYSKMNQLIKDIEIESIWKQIIISTHSSFVANKLWLDNLILLNHWSIFKLNKLKSDTEDFFKKLPWFETLRLILCKKAILVEWDWDELVIQKAYIDNNKWKLPIEDWIDVISVRGLSFLRFLEIAKELENKVTVVTDNDWDLDAIKKKYDEYLDKKKKKNIDICFDSIIDTWILTTWKKVIKNFNYNTLEPKLLKVNSVEIFNKVFWTAYKTEDDLHKYMYNNKAKCALDIFNTTEKINYPQYILDAIK